MAKESMKAREVKRAKLVAKYAAKRAWGLRQKVTMRLCRLHLVKMLLLYVCNNRCKITGRPKGYVRQFEYFSSTSEMASNGLIPVCKESVLVRVLV